MPRDRIDRDSDIDAILAQHQKDQPLPKQLLQEGLHLGRERARQVYEAYCKKHPNAPRLQTSGETRRQISSAQASAQDERVIELRNAGLSIKQIKNDGVRDVPRRVSRLTREGKIPRFQATSPKTHNRSAQALDLEKQEKSQREIAVILDMQQPSVSRLLRHGGRRPKKNISE